MRHVAPDAAERDGEPPRIGVAGNERREGTPADIDVYPAYYGGKPVFQEASPPFLILYNFN